MIASRRLQVILTVLMLATTACSPAATGVPSVSPAAAATPTPSAAGSIEPDHDPDAQRHPDGRTALVEISWLGRRLGRREGLVPVPGAPGNGSDAHKMVTDVPGEHKARVVVADGRPSRSSSRTPTPRTEFPIWTAKADGTGGGPATSCRRHRVSGRPVPSGVVARWNEARRGLAIQAATILSVAVLTWPPSP